MHEFQSHQRRPFKNLLHNYFEQRKQLVSAFVLVDIRHKPQPVDLEFMQYLGEHEFHFLSSLQKQIN